MGDEFYNYDDPTSEGTDFLNPSLGYGSPSPGNPVDTTTAAGTSAPSKVNGSSSNIIGDFVGSLTQYAGQLATTAGPIMTAIKTYQGGGTVTGTATAATNANVAAAQNTKLALSGYLKYAAIAAAALLGIGLLVWVVKKK